MSDLIDRQAAIDVFRQLADDDWNKRTGASWADGYESAIEILEELPPAQRWIPCEERLPEDGAEVWVTIKGHDVIVCEDGESVEEAINRISKVRWVTRGYWCEEENGWNSPNDGFPLMVQPIAWMPVQKPEPYKGEEDG